MNQYRELLLDVWREACRHIEISRSTCAIAGFLAPHVPIACILVRRVNPQRNWVETVARGPMLSDRPDEARSECRPAQMEAILAWCRAGKVVQGHAGLAGALPAAILPGPLDADVLAGPLELHDNRFGVLLLVARPAAIFQAEHAELVQVLLEPFAAAMENDRHVAEMAALREAAEADKRSLLNRLGREKLGGDTIVGIGSGLRAVMERVALVSKSDVPVLILGETGSGKEVVARAIHNGSPRAERPFIRVNCGAIPHELIDSQLFGHEKGAFTGATETRQGWFERADGGTLLLDELAELPLAAQVRLLRILQDGWLDRVGGQRPISVDVRIVASTHRDLPGMVAAGQFREDLWYRLAVFPIAIPPLREHREDIPELARHFARRAALRFGLYPAEPTPEDFQLLMAYTWPGNVRELATVIDRAAILGDGKQLEVAKSLGVPTSPAAAAAGVVEPAPRRPWTAKEIVPLDDMIRRHIEAALTATGGRIEGARGAATLLKINPHTLRGRMRKLKIDWKEFRE